jgi:C-terminal peptidase prc
MRPAKGGEGLRPPKVAQTEVTDMTARNLVWSLTAMLMAGVAWADSPAPKSAPKETAAKVAAAARQAWTITDLVLEQGIDPPARQQMLLYGLKALLSQDSGKAAPNLGARVSDVTTPEQFAALLAEVWPAKGTPDVNGEGPEQDLFRGLFGWRREGRAGSYLSPQQRKAHEVLVNNRYVGTGIQIRMDQKEKLTQIVVPFPGGPARKAGARPGDLIVEVDGKDMKGRPLLEVVKRLQGEEGTEVSMTVRQPGESKLRRLPMVRSVIPFTSVHGYHRTGEVSWSFRIDKEAGIGYLSIDDIKSSTLLELRQIAPLVREEGAKALVLDLRFARGEEMRHAALTADGLLDGGVLWRVRDARGRIKEYKADRDCLFRDWPMAVLVGENTGGMAAVVAAALQDRGRAIVVGEPTRGPLVQTSLVPLPESESALLLRTGKVERIERAGKPAKPREVGEESRVVPDHPVAIARAQSEAVLEWMRQQESPEPKADAKPPADPQLAKAVALLREALARQGEKGAK